MASHSIANGIAITLDGNAQCFSSMDESQDGDYNVANIAGFILTIPGDNATHQVAITVFNTGAGTSGNLDFGTLTLKQLS
jgi:hypothetical protein